MANPRPIIGGSNNITSGIALDTLINETLEFVKKQLPGWRDDPDRPENVSEEVLNGHLCDYLNYRARHDYPMAVFRHEEFQTGTRRIDMSAKTEGPIIAGTRNFTKYDPYLVIEGKRLPAPTKDREMEYVTGDPKASGGIQRFKLGLHGATLEIAAMVGYVQDNDPDAWLLTINGWIKGLDGKLCSPNCRWSSSEQLGNYRLIKHARVACATSTHPRTDACSSEIEIRHFWVSMRKKRVKAKKPDSGAATS